MAELTTGVSWLGVVVGAVVSFLVGWLWYSPKVFGVKWAKGTGVELEKASSMPVGAMAMTALTRQLYWMVSAAFVILIGFSSASADSVLATELVGFKGLDSEMQKKLGASGYRNIAYGNSVYVLPGGKSAVSWITAFRLVQKNDDYQLVVFGVHDLMARDPRVEVYRVVPATWSKKSKLFVNSGKDLQAIKASPIYEYCTLGDRYDPHLIAVAEKKEKKNDRFLPLKVWKLDLTTAQLNELPIDNVECTCNSFTCGMLNRAN